MALATYTFQRGETVRIGLATDDSTAGVTQVAAKLRRFEPGKKTFDPLHTPVAFSVTARAAAGDVAAGWDLEIDEAVSALLSPGLYQADAKITVGSDVIITEGVAIQILEPASIP